MASTAEKTDPALWEKVKQRVTGGAKGGEPGEWSARKAQLAVSEYKKEGGGYKGRKTADNHLSQWTHEEWGTKSGHKSGETGERYLPKRAREALSDSEYKRTSDKKRADTAGGKQFSAQPKDVADKVSDARLQEMTRGELMERARHRNVPGRSKMKKAELVHALGVHALGHGG